MKYCNEASCNNNNNNKNFWSLFISSNWMHILWASIAPCDYLFWYYYYKLQSLGFWGPGLLRDRLVLFLGPGYVLLYQSSRANTLFLRIKYFLIHSKMYVCMYVWNNAIVMNIPAWWFCTVRWILSPTHHVSLFEYLNKPIYALEHNK